MTAAHSSKEISWQDFRKKYIEFGGDGIYAAWALSYQETLISLGSYKKLAPHYYNSLRLDKTSCPVSEELQPKLMQFVTNYGSIEEAEPYIEALRKTVNYFA